jgi:hypothetical protein
LTRVVTAGGLAARFARLTVLQGLLWWTLWILLPARVSSPLDSFPFGLTSYLILLTASGVGTIFFLAWLRREEDPTGSPSTSLDPGDRRWLWMGLLLAVVFWWRLVFQGALPLNALSVMLFQPKASLISEYLQRGWLPLWNPWSGGGMPLAAEPQAGVFYPPNLILFVLGAARGTAAWTILHHAGLFAFAYLWMRESFDRGAAFLGAGLLAFGGYTLLRGAYFSHLAAWTWVPFLLHMAEKERWADFSLGAALQCLAGHPQFFYMTGVMTVLCLVEKERKGRFLTRLLSAGAFGVGLILFQFLPSAELIHRSARDGALAFREAVSCSLSYGEMARMFFQPLWSWGRPWMSKEVFITGFYVGLPALALAFLSWRAGRDRRRPWAWILVLTGLVLSLGASTPVYRWLYHGLPGLNLFRFPAQWMGIALIGISLLAARGWTSLPRRVGIAVALCVFADLWAFHQRSAFLYAKPGFVWELGAEALRRRNEGGRFAESFRVDAWRHGDAPTPDRGTPSARTWLDLREFALSSQGLPFHLNELRGFTIHSLKTMAASTAGATPFTEEGRAVLRRFGVRHVLDVDDPSAMTPTFRWIDIDGAWPRWRTPSGDPWPLTDVSVRPNAVSFTRPSSSDRDETMVMADAFYPGWSARSGGEPRAIEPSEEGLRRIVWRPADRTLRVRYDAPLFFLGVALSLCVGAAGFYRRSRAPRSPLPPGLGKVIMGIGGVAVALSLGFLIGMDSETNRFAPAAWAFVTRRDYIVFALTLGLFGLVQGLIGAWLRGGGILRARRSG